MTVDQLKFLPKTLWVKTAYMLSVEQRKSEDWGFGSFDTAHVEGGFGLRLLMEKKGKLDNRRYKILCNISDWGTVTKVFTDAFRRPDGMEDIRSVIELL